MVSSHIQFYFLRSTINGCKLHGGTRTNTLLSNRPQKPIEMHLKAIPPLPSSELSSPDPTDVDLPVTTTSNVSAITSPIPNIETLAQHRSRI
ncbi:unnamed protein product [Lactuca virosa]|uniref:Uncharacterized protein n=1 Tax=Lactuca virosa TaxID=75947 RepID=A0AAU9NI68_9ASTR|nr:unnamed protein product [Lactuca virosa]